jgi:hypothetical protein
MERIGEARPVVAVKIVCDRHPRLRLMQVEAQSAHFYVAGWKASDRGQALAREARAAGLAFMQREGASTSRRHLAFRKEYLPFGPQGAWWAPDFPWCDRCREAKSLSVERLNRALKQWVDGGLTGHELVADDVLTPVPTPITLRVNTPGGPVVTKRRKGA